MAFWSVYPGERIPSVFAGTLEAAGDVSDFLRALHVHHGLRGAEADRDAAFSRMLCERLEVPFYEFRIDAAKEALDRKCSVEEAGRLARYRLYEETARAWEEEIRQVHIATAHHADDNAETVLLTCSAEAV